MKIYKRILPAIKRRLTLGQLQFLNKLVGFETHPSQYHRFARQMLEGTYEKEVVDVIVAALPKGGVFLDVGANVGYISFHAAKRAGRKGRVYAFEPNPQLFPVLQRNVSRFNNGIAYNLAAGRENAKLPFYTGDWTDMGSFSREWVASIPHQTRPIAEIQVEIVPLKASLEKVGLRKIDVAKVDVEGFELEALEGMGSYVDPRVTANIFIEVNPPSQKAVHRSTQDLLGYLAKRGYRIFGIEAPWKDTEIAPSQFQQLEEKLGDQFTTVHCRA